MEGLINWMTLDDPAERPLIEEVLEKLTLIRASLSKGKLRSPITSKSVPQVFRVVRRAKQSLRTIRYVVSRRPAIPDGPDSLRASRAPGDPDSIYVPRAVASEKPYFDNFIRLVKLTDKDSNTRDSDTDSNSSSGEGERDRVSQ
jgi:hypothetical protein